MACCYSSFMQKLVKIPRHERTSSVAMYVCLKTKKAEEGCKARYDSSGADIFAWKRKRESAEFIYQHKQVSIPG